MRHLKVTGPVRRKDGSERVETQYVKVSEAQGALSIEAMGIDPARCEEVPRLPRAFERWENGGWVTDEAAKGRHEEDARLNRMSPSERQEEAIAKAVERIRGGFPSTAVFDAGPPPRSGEEMAPGATNRPESGE